MCENDLSGWSLCCTKMKKNISDGFNPQDIDALKQNNLEIIPPDFKNCFHKYILPY